MSKQTRRAKIITIFFSVTTVVLTAFIIFMLFEKNQSEPEKGKVNEKQSKRTSEKKKSTRTNIATRLKQLQKNKKIPDYYKQRYQQQTNNQKRFSRKIFQDLDKFKAKKKDEVEKVKKFHLKSLQKKFGDKITELQTSKVLAAAAKARTEIMDNQYNFYNNHISQGEARGKSASILRNFSRQLLEILGEEGYIEYTGYEPEDDPYERLTTGGAGEVQNSPASEDIQKEIQTEKKVD